MSVDRAGDGEQANKKLRVSVQPVSEEDGHLDRISSLPEGVIDRILELMPAYDAARTCVLSRKWRYMWANTPTMVVDHKFLCDYGTKIKRLHKYPADFVDIINTMFLHHTGHINKCVLNTLLVSPDRHCVVDLWLSILSRRGVKVLKLEGSISNTYAVPSCVFSNFDLTELSISNCIFKKTKFFPSLNKLESLDLEKVTLPSLVLETPLLSSLSLKLCHAVIGFIVSAPQLMTLTLSRNDDLNLVPYLTCSNIEYAYIYVNKNIEHQVTGENINLMKLLRCWPKISAFSLDGSSLKYLTKGIAPKEFSLMLSLKRFVPFNINYDRDQISWVLRILQNSPLLHEFEIWYFRDVARESEMVNYLEESNVVNQRMEKLRVVKMRPFNGSRTELLFIKILLRSAPSLERMVVEEDEILAFAERLRLSKQLMRLPRASPSAEIIFEPTTSSEWKVRS